MMGFEAARERIALRNVDTEIVKRLTAELNIPEAIAMVLAGRNLDSFDSCKSFFRPDLSHLYDPFLFSQMEQAVHRIETALKERQKIVVYGDYDVDGVTSTAFLIRVLRSLGANCDYYLPNRLTEGYGLSAAGIQTIIGGGAGLIITVDCGVTSVNEILIAKTAGVDCIVTDHHEPKEILPCAVAILNPKIPGSNYPDTSLAGVGVVLKLCQALGISTGNGEELWRPYLDLVALGTAADIVPLTGENRIIAKFGFELLMNSLNKGINALVAQQGLSGKRLSTSQIVFQIAPCINAVGRIGDPRRGVELLLTEDASSAAMYASELREANLERRSLDSAVAEEAFFWVDENCSPEKDFGLVVGDQDWHVGVIGIVASKLVERYNRPSILLSIGADGVARGSGRSIPGLHLLDALNECSDMLDSFGGHAAAAGLSIQRCRIEEFRSRFNEVVAKRLKQEDLVPVIMADAEVALTSISPKFCRIIKEMEPFGPGNMRPVFLCRDLQNKYPPRIVGSNHLKLSVTGGGVVMDAIGFNLGDRMGEIRGAGSMSLAFTLDENEWNGKVTMQMKVKGISV
jgi:single-stranded-DNA-specific exonuclease